MKKKIIIFIALFTCITSIYSLNVPALKGRVNDYAGVLTSNQKDTLEKQLTSYESTTSSQIAVLIISTLEGNSIEEYSIRVVDKWKLGTSENDNGVLLLVSLNDKKIRIEAGYGLEGTLTDLKADYIIRNVITPYFKQNQYFEGIKQGLTGISGVITGEYQITTKDIQKTQKSSSSGSSPASLIFIIMFILISSLGRRGFRGRRGRGFGTFLILNSILGGSSRGSSGFGGSSGGFGGGGFSGGGGGFGGGGASGSW